VTSKTSAFVAASALLLVAGLTGCGSDDGGTVATSGATRSTPTSASASATGQTGAALFASMTAAMAQAKSATMTFSSSVAGQQIHGSGGFRFATGDVAADVAVAVPGQGTVRVILLPKAFYLRLPASAGLPPGKPWLKVGTTRASGSDPLAAAFGPLVEALKASFDPQSNLGLLTATTSVTATGTDRVEGVPTTKYTAVVDLAKAAEVAKGPLADQYRTMVGSGVTKLDYSIWVDHEDLPRQFSTVLPTAQGKVTASGTYRDWGTPVHIAAPPASQVASGAYRPLAH
jgi:hypothetical protein